MMTPSVETLMFVALRMLDHALGWLLSLPVDFALITLGVLSGGALLIARITVGNPGLQQRCKSDRKCIKALCKAARAAGDAGAVKRLRNLAGLIALKQLKLETKVMLCAAPLMILLTAWCSERLQYPPVRPGDSIELIASFPDSNIGDLVHLVPDPALLSDNGWVQAIRPAQRDRTRVGKAHWMLRVQSQGVQTIAIRHRGRTLTQRLQIGPYGAELLEVAASGIQLDLNRTPVMLFNLLPGIQSLGIPPYVSAIALLCILTVALGNQIMAIALTRRIPRESGPYRHSRLSCRPIRSFSDDGNTAKSIHSSPGVYKAPAGG